MKDFINTINSPAAVAIADKVRVLESQGLKIAKLQTGEPSFPTPQYIKDSVLKHIELNRTTYTNSQGIPELRTAISNWYKDEFNVQIDPANILISNGGVHAIFVAISALINQNDDVLILDPAWPQYENIVKINGANAVRVRSKNLLTGPSASEVIENFNSNSKLLIINNPSNPSGNVFSKDWLEEVIESFVSKGGYVLVDEVYNRLTYTDNFVSCLQLEVYKKYPEQIIYINSFSKSFSMTGWRIGYLFTSPNKINGMLKVSQNTITNVATFIQYAAADAINFRSENIREFEKMNEFYEKRKQQIEDLLDKLGKKYIKPHGAFYCFIDAEENGNDFCEKLLKNNAISTVPGSAYGADYINYYRISYAVDEYSFSTFINWLNSQL